MSLLKWDIVENNRYATVKHAEIKSVYFVDIYLESVNFEERCNAKKEALEKLVWDRE